MSKLWGGRFSEKTEQIVEEFSSSLSLDHRMWKEDIQASVAHAQMLSTQKILAENEATQIIDGLKDIESEIEESLKKGIFPFSVDSEDIHSEIEIRLHAKVGALSGKLHTARSRNDQVATDLRLYLRNQISSLNEDIMNLQKWILNLAPNHLNSILPGLTHMQHGQPVSLAHHLMAYFWMLQRDRTRLQDCIHRMNSLPLGCAALAGTSFPIDRQQVAHALGFDSVIENSLDGVSDRDFGIEFLGAASILMMHLSRWSEEIVLWSMPEFQFIELSDSVTTGSSIMPQKKNPDVSELIRGRTGRVNGALMGLLTIMKALPLSYQRDLQEDKFHLFEALDTVKFATKLMLCQLEKAQFRTDKMYAKVHGDFSNATDLADDLAKKGIPFREAHEIVGLIVQDCIANQKSIEDLSLEELRKFNHHFDLKTLQLVKPINVVKARTSEGGTSPDAVLLQIEKAQLALLN